jgi:hypothetical protein
MDPFLVQVFRYQVEFQCKAILKASAEIDAGVAAEPGGDAYGVFYGIQNLLVAAANCSKALWGEGGRLSTQRQPLRDALGVTDASPLKDVNMRNNFEHFDERLDRWWTESPNHNIADLNLGTVRMITGLAAMENFRQFDPDSGDLLFWGDRFNINALVGEARAILSRA